MTDDNLVEVKNLEIGYGKLRSLRSGSKMYTIRRGHRTFDKNISVSSRNQAGGTDTYPCIVNAFIHTVLSEVPFVVLESEGFTNLKECRDILRLFYPEIDYESEVTIVELRGIV